MSFYVFIEAILGHIRDNGDKQNDKNGEYTIQLFDALRCEFKVEQIW